MTIQFYGLTCHLILSAAPRSNFVSSPKTSQFIFDATTENTLLEKATIGRSALEALAHWPCDACLHVLVYAPVAAEETKATPGCAEVHFLKPSVVYIPGTCIEACVKMHQLEGNGTTASPPASTVKYRLFALVRLPPRSASYFIHFIVPNMFTRTRGG